MITEIYIGTDRLDLYEDENIVITSSVANIQDTTKIYTDYSRNINIPATHKNNRILKHWYSSKVVDGFDNRIRKAGKISLGGVDFRYGKFNIQKVVLKNGKPSNYTLNFVGNLIELKEKFGDEKLSDLDFSDLDFIYNYSNVIDKLKDGDNIDLAASFFTNKRMIYDSSESVQETDTQTNIYYNGDDNNSGIKWNEIKLSVRLIAIIEAITEKYGIVFSDDFTKNYHFKSSYLLLDRKTEVAKNTSKILFDTTDDPLVDISSSSIPDSSLVSRLRLIINTTSSVSYRLFVKSDDLEIYSKNLNGNSSNDFTTTKPNLTFWIESESSLLYSFEMERRVLGSPILTYYTEKYSSLLQSNYSVSENIPDMNVFEFIEGLIKVYKLVLIPNDDGSIFMDTLNNYYKKGTLYRGFEKYIDVSNIEVSDIEKTNLIKYKFQDPSTILNKKFKELNGVGFGDYNKSILDLNGNIIDGKEQPYEVPFEQVVYEGLYDINSEDIRTKMVYGLIANEEVKPTSTKGHLHFLTSSFPFGVNGIKIIDDSNDGVRFNELSNFPNTADYATNPINSFLFGEELDIYTNTPILNNLYTNFHESNIDRITDINNRYLTLSAKKVSTRIINNLKLNDVLEIRNEFYRVDKMDINITTKDIKFYLLKDVNVDLEYTEPVTFDRTGLTWDSDIITFDNI